MRKFKIATYKIKTMQKNNSPSRPVRIVVLADLHCTVYGENNIRLIQAVYKINPDIVMVVGDMLVSKPDKPTDMDSTVFLLKALVKKYPVYYSNGNHEYRMKIYPQIYGDVYERFQKEIRSIGVVLLENERCLCKAAGMKMIIHGYELDKRFFKRFSRERLGVEEMNQALGRPDEKGYHILLAHNPVFFKTYAGWGADLTLSGHLHGGMIRLPLLGGVISPQVQIFPKYDKGLFHIGRHQLVVSAGLGSHSIKLRFHNPTELVVVELQ
ncbi:metallophosphoesterase [Robinsoniella sp. KNHs210]|uniref:metallophosphoesterase n=1 Tax=Robinsoniella sp. KNHs210 TaxID=1469950 RepID=UPI00048062B6|nr:metallophosphoesterase [Robinsoniella sp. KNHs210]